MTASEPVDPLFWPLMIFAVVFAASLVAIVVTVVVLTRRSPGHHPQIAGHGGSNTYDASSHTSTSTTVMVDTINVHSPRLAGFPPLEAKRELEP